MLVVSTVVGEGVDVSVKVVDFVGMPRKELQNGVTEMEAFERAVAIREA